MVDIEIYSTSVRSSINVTEINRYVQISVFDHLKLSLKYLHKQNTGMPKDGGQNAFDITICECLILRYIDIQPYKSYVKRNYSYVLQ